MRVAAAVALAVASTSAHAQQAIAPRLASYAPAPDGPEAVLARINDARRAEGLSELAPDPALTRAAGGYAADLAMRGDVSHEGADGSSPPDRANAAGYPGRYVGETLAAGYDDAGALVADWMESPLHRETLLLSRASDIGVGLAVDPQSEYQTYWTVLVAAPSR